MRKQLLLGALTAFGFMTTLQVSAQENSFKCGLPNQLSKLYAAHPELEADYRQLVESNKETRVINGQTRTVYIIPIVFHVVHEYGSENIADAQIYDQMDILNEDFRMLNADVNNVQPEYDTVAGDMMIEFRLARLDPYGNCTNGIEHIYSHQANAADDYSKLHQWNRAQYLNVWVVNTIGEAGVAGYAYYPTATTGGFFFADGIIILNDYVGSIGTSAPWSSRALTHEIGHYLGLAHTWGSTNDPTLACGDDDVDDTPITKGHDACTLADLRDTTCVPGIVENTENFMEYSYCSKMYTKGQVTFVHNVLSQETADRNNLYTAENQALTGIDVDPAPLCKPVADFSVNKRMTCVGDAVQFTDFSWNAAVDSREWIFEGGSPATATTAQPSVTYAQDGYYDVTLIVQNTSGSDTMVFPNMIFVSAGWADFTGPYNEDFESGSAGWWHTQNPENNHARFNLINGVGRNNTRGFMLNNYKDVSQAEAFTNDWFYYDRLGGSKDYLISPSFDLASTSNVTVSFDYAYGTKATALADITEEVRVYTSRDCGQTWQLRSNATLSQEEVITAGYVGSTNYVPTSDQEWRTQSFSYTPTAQDTKLRFRFEFIASDKSSNFFFDNFNISGTLNVKENGESLGISIAPNPVVAGSEVAVEIGSSSEDVELQLVDVNGALISVTKVVASNGTQTVMVPMNVSKGCYFINAIKGNVKSTNRVIVF